MQKIRWTKSVASALQNMKGNDLGSVTALASEGSCLYAETRHVHVACTIPMISKMSLVLDPWQAS